MSATERDDRTPRVEKGDVTASLHLALPIGKRDSSDDAQRECWICREPAAKWKPLMSFCKCKGSMRGVHAECVEHWIKLQRVRGHGESPRCTVCSHNYDGHEQYPSMFFFCGSLCGRILRFSMRAFILASVLLAYWRGLTIKPAWLGYLLVAMALLYLMGQMCSELWAAVIVSCIGVMEGRLTWYSVIPLAVLASVPAVHVVSAHPSMRCLHAAFGLIVAICLSPIFLLVTIIQSILADPRRICHVGDAMFHLYIALACMLVAIFCSSLVPLIIVWCIHIALIAIGAAATLLKQCPEWRESRTWIFSWELTLICTYYINVYRAPFDDATGTYCALTSAAWLCTVTALAGTVNKALLLDYYDQWLRRHAVFSLRGGLLENDSLNSV
eukprot:GEMP01060277.1.p1 GENE.GEMP01060277.1~~GEMP01060277.1.p1  ORF type:complete len:399 (+),score=51.65 GEMP01060277.1:45-1199(+)